MRNIYQQALDVQNACNSSGVALSLANEIIPAVRDELRANGGFADTDAVNSHPAVIMFIAKLGDLAGLTVDGARYSRAYTVCYEMAHVAAARQELAVAVALAAAAALAA